MHSDRFFEAEVRVTLTSVAKIVETFMVLRDNEGHIVEESLWSRKLASLSE